MFLLSAIKVFFAKQMRSFIRKHLIHTGVSEADGKMYKVISLNYREYQLDEGKSSTFFRQH